MQRKEMLGWKWNNLAISSVMLKMLHSFYTTVARSSENNVGHILCYLHLQIPTLIDSYCTYLGYCS